jgi:hypothetical protein
MAKCGIEDAEDAAEGGWPVDTAATGVGGVHRSLVVLPVHAPLQRLRVHQQLEHHVNIHLHAPPLEVRMLGTDVLWPC